MSECNKQGSPFLDSFCQRSLHRPENRMTVSHRLMSASSFSLCNHYSMPIDFMIILSLITDALFFKTRDSGISMDIVRTVATIVLPRAAHASLSVLWNLNRDSDTKLTDSRYSTSPGRCRLQVQTRSFPNPYTFEHGTVMATGTSSGWLPIFIWVPCQPSTSPCWLRSPPSTSHPVSLTQSSSHPSAPSLGVASSWLLRGCVC